MLPPTNDTNILFIFLGYMYLSYIKKRTFWHWNFPAKKILLNYFFDFWGWVFLIFFFFYLYLFCFFIFILSFVLDFYYFEYYIFMNLFLFCSGLRFFVVLYGIF